MPSSRGAEGTVAIQEFAPALWLLDCSGLRPRNDGKTVRTFGDWYYTLLLE
jgi:hypothetical protein